MKKLLIFLSVLLFGANLINVNFFPEKNKVDILFSLDSKFNGKIIELGKNRFLITNIISNNKTDKNFKNYFLKKIEIIPGKNGVLIKIYSKSKYKTSVALTPDGYGLRFRIKNLKSFSQITKLENSNPQKGLDYFTYILSLSILLIIAVGLFVFKKRLVKKLPVKTNITILFQKPLDPKNRVALIEFNKRKYLVLIGNTNILLDVFDENMVNLKTQEDFDSVLEKNIEKLDNFKQYIQNAEKLKEFDEKI